jgi:signal transduction histidine kinase
MQAQADTKQQQLSFTSAAAPILIQGDADLLAVALRNLIENALRYTPAGGVIEVRADLATDLASKQPLLVVRDSGPGVNAEEAPRLLERFYRGQAAANAEGSHGSGLGLAIVQRIADLHGAKLEIETHASGGLASG